MVWYSRVEDDITTVFEGCCSVWRREVNSVQTGREIRKSPRRRRWRREIPITVTTPRWKWTGVGWWRRPRMILRKKRNSVADRDADYCVFVTMFVWSWACRVWRCGSSSWWLLLFSSLLIGLLCKFCVVEEQNNRISLPDDACQQAAF